MRRLFFITHAEVQIDPGIAVTDWALSPVGCARHEALAAAPALAQVAVVFSSTERKAREGAGILARARGIRHLEAADLHENDRSATGYLPRAEFEATADDFFAMPDRSIRGWETARSARTRIVAACRRIAAHSGPGDIAVVSHGGVGALLLSHVNGAEISRRFDQPGEGGGNVLALTLPDLELLQGWTPIEQLAQGALT